MAECGTCGHPMSRHNSDGCNVLRDGRFCGCLVRNGCLVEVPHQRCYCPCGVATTVVPLGQVSHIVEGCLCPATPAKPDEEVSQ